MARRVFITGGSGFIGANLVRAEIGAGAVSVRVVPAREDVVAAREARRVLRI